MKLNYSWVLQIARNEAVQVDDFLEAFNYEVYEVGDRSSFEVYYIYNPVYKCAYKYGGVNFNGAQDRIFDNIEQLIEAHFEKV